MYHPLCSNVHSPVFAGVLVVPTNRQNHYLPSSEVPRYFYVPKLVAHVCKRLRAVAAAGEELRVAFGLSGLVHSWDAGVTPTIEASDGTLGGTFKARRVLVGRSQRGGSLVQHRDLADDSTGAARASPDRDETRASRASSPLDYRDTGGERVPTDDTLRSSLPHWEEPEEMQLMHLKAALNAGKWSAVDKCKDVRLLCQLLFDYLEHMLFPPLDLDVMDRSMRSRHYPAATVAAKRKASPEPEGSLDVDKRSTESHVKPPVAAVSGVGAETPLHRPVSGTGASEADLTVAGIRSSPSSQHSLTLTSSPAPDYSPRPGREDMLSRSLSRHMPIPALTQQRSEWIPLASTPRKVFVGGGGARTSRPRSGKLGQRTVHASQRQTPTATQSNNHRAGADRGPSSGPTSSPSASAPRDGVAPTSLKLPQAASLERHDSALSDNYLRTDVSYSDPYLAYTLEQVVSLLRTVKGVQRNLFRQCCARLAIAMTHIPLAHVHSSVQNPKVVLNALAQLVSGGHAAPKSDKVIGPVYAPTCDTGTWEGAALPLFHGRQFVWDARDCPSTWPYHLHAGVRDQLTRQTSQGSMDANGTAQVSAHAEPSMADDVLPYLQWFECVVRHWTQLPSGHASFDIDESGAVPLVTTRTMNQSGTTRSGSVYVLQSPQHRAKSPLWGSPEGKLQPDSFQLPAAQYPSSNAQATPSELTDDSPKSADAASDVVVPTPKRANNGDSAPSTPGASGSPAEPNNNGPRVRIPPIRQPVEPASAGSAPPLSDTAESAAASGPVPTLPSLSTRGRGARTPQPTGSARSLLQDAASAREHGEAAKSAVNTPSGAQNGHAEGHDSFQDPPLSERTAHGTIMQVLDKLDPLARRKLLDDIARSMGTELGMMTPQSAGSSLYHDTARHRATSMQSDFDGSYPFGGEPSVMSSYDPERPLTGNSANFQYSGRRREARLSRRSSRPGSGSGQPPMRRVASRGEELRQYGHNPPSRIPSFSSIGGAQASEMIESLLDEVGAPAEARASRRSSRVSAPRSRGGIRGMDMTDVLPRPGTGNSQASSVSSVGRSRGRRTRADRHRDPPLSTPASSRPTSGKAASMPAPVGAPRVIETSQGTPSRPTAHLGRRLPALQRPGAHVHSHPVPVGTPPQARSPLSKKTPLAKLGHIAPHRLARMQRRAQALPTVHGSPTAPVRESESGHYDDNGSGLRERGAIVGEDLLEASVGSLSIAEDSWVQSQSEAAASRGMAALYASQSNARSPQSGNKSPVRLSPRTPPSQRPGSAPRGRASRDLTEGGAAQRYPAVVFEEPQSGDASARSVVVSTEKHRDTHHALDDDLELSTAVPPAASASLGGDSMFRDTTSPLSTYAPQRTSPRAYPAPSSQPSPHIPAAAAGDESAPIEPARPPEAPVITSGPSSPLRSKEHSPSRSRQRSVSPNAVGQRSVCRSPIRTKPAQPDLAGVVNSSRQPTPQTAASVSVSISPVTDQRARSEPQSPASSKPQSPIQRVQKSPHTPPTLVLDSAKELARSDDAQKFSATSPSKGLKYSPSDLRSQGRTADAGDRETEDTTEVPPDEQILPHTTVPDANSSNETHAQPQVQLQPPISPMKPGSEADQPNSAENQFHTSVGGQASEVTGRDGEDDGYERRSGDFYHGRRSSSVSDRGMDDISEPATPHNDDVHRPLPSLSPRAGGGVILDPMSPAGVNGKRPRMKRSLLDRPLNSTSRGTLGLGSPMMSMYSSVSSTQLPPRPAPPHLMMPPAQDDSASSEDEAMQSMQSYKGVMQHETAAAEKKMTSRSFFGRRKKKEVLAGTGREFKTEEPGADEAELDANADQRF